MASSYGAVVRAVKVEDTPKRPRWLNAGTVLTAVVLGSAAVLLTRRSAAPMSLEQLMPREQLMPEFEISNSERMMFTSFAKKMQSAPRAAQSMLEIIGPHQQQTRKSRRTLALEAYLNGAMQGVQTLGQVDHHSLAAGLRAHL